MCVGQPGDNGLSLHVLPGGARISQRLHILAAANSKNPSTANRNTISFRLAGIQCVDMGICQDEHYSSTSRLIKAVNSSSE